MGSTLFMLVGCGMTQIQWLWLAIHCQYSILRVFILLTLPLAGQWLDTSQPGKWQGHLYCSHFILCTAKHRERSLSFWFWTWQCCEMLNGPVSVRCKCPYFHLAGSTELEPGGGGGARWLEVAGGRAGRGMPGSGEGWPGPGYLHSPAGAASSCCTGPAPASLQAADWPDGMVEVDTFADFTRNSSNEYSVPWSQVWPDSRLSDIDKTGSSHQPGPPLLQSTICYQMTSSQKVNFSVYCDLGPGGY